ncbi:MAG: AAA family ATPase [Promethearchaeota archaeon]
METIIADWTFQFFFILLLIIFILTGPPGTGKSYLAQLISQSLVGERYEIVQFHPKVEIKFFFDFLSDV